MSPNVEIEMKRIPSEDLQKALEALAQLKIQRDALPNKKKRSLDDDLQRQRRAVMAEEAKVFWSDNRETLGNMSHFRDVVHLVGETAVTTNSSNALTLAFMLTDQLRRGRSAAADASATGAQSGARVTNHHLVYLSHGRTLLKEFCKLLDHRVRHCFDTEQDRAHFGAIIDDVLRKSEDVDFKNAKSVRIESGGVAFELHPGLQATTNSVREGMKIGGVAFTNFRRLQTILRGKEAGSKQKCSGRPAAFITAQRKAESTVLSLAAASCNGTVLFMRYGGKPGDSCLRQVNMSAMHKMKELEQKLDHLWKERHLIAAKRLIDAEAGLFDASTEPYLDANAVLTGMYVAWDRLEFAAVAAKYYAPTMRASESDASAFREPSREPSGFTATARSKFDTICDAHQNAAKDMVQLTAQKKKKNPKLDGSLLPTCAHIRALIRSSADIAVAENHYTTLHDGNGGPPRTLLPYWELMQ